MLILITGGSGSGKSAYAEEQVLRLGSRRRIYLATMMSFDEESKKRIARHRKMRESKNFETIEHYMDLRSLSLPKGCTVLLECMSNLAANEMYAPGGAGERTAENILRGVESILAQAEHLVVVTNEVFSDGQTYDPETMRYLEHLGRVNRELAVRADLAWEVVCGIPLPLKGAGGR